MRSLSPGVPMPRYAWIAVVLEIFTGVLAIPVGLLFLSDPTGKAIGVPQGWIEATVFGSYVVPGLYLLLVNGFGMLALAALTVLRHPLAPWLTGALGIGLMIWIAVQALIMPETMFLQPLFFAVGLALGVIALFWLRSIEHLGRS
jgi:hypothetical protein